MYFFVLSITCATLTLHDFLSESEFAELQNYLRDVNQNKNFKELENWPALRS